MNKEELELAVSAARERFKNQNEFVWSRYLKLSSRKQITLVQNLNEAVERIDEIHQCLKDQTVLVATSSPDFHKKISSWFFSKEDQHRNRFNFVCSKGKTKRQLVGKKYLFAIVNNLSWSELSYVCERVEG